MSIDIVNKKKQLFPELYNTAGSSNVGSNSLGQTADTLWQTVASTVIQKSELILAPLSELSTDLTNDIVVTPPGVQPTAYVEVVDGMGDALVNATDWEQSAATNRYVPVVMNRISRPFGLSSYDLAHGERIDAKLVAAIEAVAKGVFTKFVAALAAKMPTVATTDVAATATALGTKMLTGYSDIDPVYVTKTLSPIFGETGKVDNLVLGPNGYAQLIPTNALSLQLAKGTYGMGSIHESAMLSGVSTGMDVYGLAMRKNAVAFAGCRPYIDEDFEIAVRDLGTICGLPLLLKSWTVKGKELIYNSVETMAGFAIANTDGVFVLGKKSS